MMKTCLFALSMLLAAPSFAQQSVPDIPFDSVPNFLKLPPGMNFGEVPGVAVNSKGHVFVFTRSNSANGPAYAPTAAQLLEFGPKGEFLREIGKGLYGWSFAHSVRIDKDDNIWAIDKGSDMIIKFNPAGQVIWVFGRRKESADAETKPWENVNPPLPPVDGLFRQPTDVAWDSEGNIYISDGYVNSRVAKYDKNGDWVKSWGEKGTGPGSSACPMPSRWTATTTSTSGDRSNRRIQVFDTDGKFLRMFTIDVPPDPGTRAVNGNTPTGAAPGRGHRGAQFDLHHARPQPGDVRRRNHLPGADLQGVARREGARGDRPLRTRAQTVLRRPRAGVPVGERDLRRGDLELARAEVDPSSAATTASEKNRRPARRGRSQTRRPPTGAGSSWR